MGEDGFKNNTAAAGNATPAGGDGSILATRGFIQEDGRSVCTICSKSFPRKHQMILHMNIHYMERKFRCEPCEISFRTQGTLQKHEHSAQHKNKVLMTSTFGVATTTNPRPFECSDCTIGFRIHGHLAKHLRSKSHIQKWECLQKLPFGTYAEIERLGLTRLTDIDTTDCESSLAGLKALAHKLFEKDPAKLVSWNTNSTDNSNAPAANYTTSESRESNSDDSAAEAIHSPDDGSGFMDTESSIVAAITAETTDVMVTGKRKIDAISGLENQHEKRLKIVGDT